MAHIWSGKQGDKRVVERGCRLDRGFVWRRRLDCVPRAASLLVKPMLQSFGLAVRAENICNSLSGRALHIHVLRARDRHACPRGSAASIVPLAAFMMRAAVPIVPICVLQAVRYRRFAPVGVLHPTRLARRDQLRFISSSNVAPHGCGCPCVTLLQHKFTLFGGAHARRQLLPQTLRHAAARQRIT